MIGHTALHGHSSIRHRTAGRQSLLGVRNLAISLFLLAGAIALWLGPLPAEGREKDGVPYGAGLIVNVPMPEAEVAQAVDEVVKNGIIRGTKEYNKDEYVAGANEATSTRAFPAWTEGGKVFYKIRTHALDPRNFKDGGDVGTLAVRYVVQGQGEKNTVLRIDAVFVEEFRHTVRASNGSVEGAEYKDIHDHLEAMELVKQEAAQPQQQLVSRKLLSKDEPSLTPVPQPVSRSEERSTEDSQQPPVAPKADESAEQHLQNLRRQVERLVKSPGAPLKASPFHTASTLRSLPPGTEVLILISTPYWYGIETHDGQHGWVSRDQLEQLP